MVCRGQHDDNSHGCYYNQEQAKIFFYDDFRYGLVYVWNKANTEFMYFYDLIVSVTNVRIRMNDDIILGCSVVTNASKYYLKKFYSRCGIEVVYTIVIMK